MIRSVQARVLDQDVETVEERPSGRAAARINLNGVRDGSLLRMSVLLSL